MVKTTVKEIKVGDRIKFGRSWWQVVEICHPKRHGRPIEGEILLILQCQNQEIRQIFDEDTDVLCQAYKPDTINRQKAQEWLKKTKTMIENWQYLHTKLNRKGTKKSGGKNGHS